jgi:hypothetical protein
MTPNSLRMEHTWHNTLIVLFLEAWPCTFFFVFACSQLLFWVMPSCELGAGGDVAALGAIKVREGLKGQKRTLSHDKKGRCAGDDQLGVVHRDLAGWEGSRVITWNVPVRPGCWRKLPCNHLASEGGMPCIPEHASKLSHQL